GGGGGGGRRGFWAALRRVGGGGGGGGQLPSLQRRPLTRPSLRSGHPLPAKAGRGKVLAARAYRMTLSRSNDSIEGEAALMREVIAAPLGGLDLRRHYGHHQSPAIRAGGLIFCSGMLPIDAETGERCHRPLPSQAHLSFL